MAETSLAAPWEGEASQIVNGEEKPRRDAGSRVTVRLTGELGEAIESLQEITTASSPSEVVRRAIVVYHTLVQQKMRGNEPVIEVHEGGSVRKVPIFL
jgi:hypothetical protein